VSLRGEEFLVILPVADLKATQARAERIRSKLHDLKVVHQGQALGMVTVSVGVAELPLHGTMPKELSEAADAALYRAKKGKQGQGGGCRPRAASRPGPTANHWAESALTGPSFPSSRTPSAKLFPWIAVLCDTWTPSNRIDNEGK
jgi:GGDEF domain-containing protein